jgi:tryptophan-rich sensory protein
MWSDWTQIIIFALVAIIFNIIGSDYGKSNPYYKRSPGLPSGWFIGIVWVVIFGLLGYAHFLVYKEEETFTIASIAIILTALFCVSYTFIVRYRPEYIHFLNVISLIIAFTLGLLVLRESETAFWYVLPLIVWVAYVNMLDSLVICKVKTV